MQNVTVECPHCHSNLEAPASLNGSEVECPACKQNFTISIKKNPEAKTFTYSMSAIKQLSLSALFGKFQNLPAVISILALLISIAAIIVVLSSSSSFPKLQMSTEPSRAIKNHLTFQIKLKSIGDYFYQKNGDKILDSLDIKEIKTNGNWAIGFYKLSFGATEVKDVMYLYKSVDGYWINTSSYVAEKKCQTNWYKDMKNKIERFVQDSGEFDVLDL